MTRVRGAALTLAVLLAVAGGSLLLAARADEFPHEKHARLFPLCIGCHVGIPTGTSSEYYPPAASCSACHDGTRAPAIDWTGPAPRSTNLRFEHTVHQAGLTEAGEAELECETCHTQPGAPRMRVEPPIPGRCFDCHTHQASNHFVDAACTGCHVPLAESRLDAARLANLPEPATHASVDFLAGAHGRLAVSEPAVCATCHVREQCLGCHVTTASTSAVNRIAAARSIQPRQIAARYPLPASHSDPAWERRHGTLASVEACATCHTRESCTTCHLSPPPAAVARLTPAREAAAPGVTVMRRRPASHASAYFATLHGPLAAARPQSCTVCHQRRSLCATCHEPGGISAVAGQRDGPPAAQPPSLTLLRDITVSFRHDAELVADTPAGGARIQPSAQPRAASAPRATRGFHPRNYMLRHSAEAYGRRLDCTSCHSTQLFCRDCHESRGTTAVGRLGAGFHDAQPVWLLRHGQAARQTLESCTTCHTQRDCMQCHSTIGAFRVNPHGPGLDLRRAERANPQICRACHLDR